MPNNQNPVEFYEMYNLPKQYGFTPSIVNMLGGVSSIDSYTPLSAARNTFNQMAKYLTQPTGRPITMADLVDYMYRVADRYGINRDVAYKQIEAESRFDPEARSAAGAVGIAQFMPATARQYGLDDRTDPYASLDAWGAYMSDLLNLFDGDYSKALAGYNWGQGRVMTAVKNFGQGWLERAPKETRDYVEKILGAFQYPGAPVAPGQDPARINDPLTEAEKRRAQQYRQPNVIGVNCDTFNLACHFEKLVTGETAKDLGKRLGLVLLAGLLLAIAVYSFK